MGLGTRRFSRPALPFCSFVEVVSLRRSSHSGRKGYVLKVSSIHSTTLSKDLAVVMVTFFKIPHWDFHCYPTLERKSTSREVCIQRDLRRARLSLTSILIEFLFCRGNVPYIPTFSWQCSTLCHSWAGWIESHLSPASGGKLLGAKLAQLLSWWQSTAWQWLGRQVWEEHSNLKQATPQPAHRQNLRSSVQSEKAEPLVPKAGRERPFPFFHGLSAF